MAVYLSKDAPKFESRVKGLVLRPHASLHQEILLRVAIVVWALNFVCVPNVAVVCFDPLARLKAVSEFIHENFYIVPLTGGVGSADPG